jgi:hypothetical protein
VLSPFFKGNFSILFYLAIDRSKFLNMSLEEFENTPDNKTKRYILMKSIMDFGMGFLYIGVGILIFFSKQFHLNNNFTESTLGKIFAGLIIIYGAWRFYRGIRKDYFRER